MINGGDGKIFREQTFDVHLERLRTYSIFQYFHHVLIDNAVRSHQIFELRFTVYFFGQPKMFRSPRNSFDDTLSAKRSAAAAAYAATLAEVDTEDASPEHLEQRRQVALLASQAAMRAGVIAEAAELAAVAANTAALAAAAAGVDVFNSVVAIQGAVNHCKVDSLGLLVYSINEKFAEEEAAVARLIEFANASSKMATLAAEAAAEAAEAAALIAETAMEIICNANRILTYETTLSDKSGLYMHSTDNTEDEFNTKSFPKGQWITFMNRFSD